MSKYFNLLRVALSLSVMFLMCSCTDNGKKDDAAGSTNSAVSTSTPASTDTSPSTTSTGAQANLSMYLKTLWIESEEFNKLPNRRLVMSFIFEKDDVLTLHGWYCSFGCTGDKFPDQVPIKLKQGAETDQEYKPGVYFGDVIVTKVNKVQNIAEKYKNVVFVPTIKDGFIWYDIYVTNDDPTKPFKSFVSVDTEVDGNPSPPRN